MYLEVKRKINLKYSKLFRLVACIKLWFYIKKW